MDNRHSITHLLFTKPINNWGFGYSIHDGVGLDV